MPIRHVIWGVGSTAAPLDEVVLGDEGTLEQMIITVPTILSERWILIGRQLRTAFGKLIDFFALNTGAHIIAIEPKRN